MLRQIEGVFMKWFKCCHCQMSFPETDFYNDKSKPSGKKPRCKECDKQSLNKQIRREYEKQYRVSNPLKRRTILSKWYETNKDHFKEVQAKYRETEQFKTNHRNHSAIRRSRLRGNKFETIDFLAIYKDHPFCFYCGKHLLLIEVEFDHFVPVSKGGNHTTDNIRVSCMICNRRKGAMSYQMV